MKLKADITGLDAAIAAVRNLPGEVVRPAAEDALKELTARMVKAARRNLKANDSVITRALYRSIGRRVKVYRGRYVVALVGPRKDTKRTRFSFTTTSRTGRRKTHYPHVYARWVEFGTVPHSVARGARMNTGTGRRPTGQRAPWHPGAKLKPFLRPAMEAHEKDLPGLLKLYVNRRLDRMLKTTSRRAA